MEVNPEPTLADDEARLAAFAEQLIEQVDTSIGGWVRRSVFAAAGAGGVKVVEGDLAPVIDQTRGAAMPEIRRVLRADVDTGAGSPLAALRNAVGPMTDLLDRWGAPPPRDEFLERQFPGDPYQLGPAAFSDVDEASTSLGSCGAQHVPTCISAVDGSPIMADHVVVTRDLMDGSRFRSAVPGVVIVRSVDAPELAGARSCWSILRSVSTLRARGDDRTVIAYGSHVDEEALQSAITAGCAALPRSKVFRRAAELLAD